MENLQLMSMIHRWFSHKKLDSTPFTDECLAFPVKGGDFPSPPACIAAKRPGSWCDGMEQQQRPGEQCHGIHLRQVKLVGKTLFSMGKSPFSSIF